MGAAILVGIDGSIASRAAITWSIERAEHQRADVTLLEVVDDEWGTIGERDLGELHKSAAEIAERELAFARSAARHPSITAELAVGNPMLTLASTAREFELVAIGTHKSGSFHGHALGSRSLQLAAMSPVPTAVIPHADPRGRSGVAVGVGVVPGWMEPVRFAVREASRLDEPLLLIRSERAGLADPMTDEAVMRLVTELPEAAECSAGISLRRSTSPAGEALAAVSRRAVVTVSGRPTEHGARGFRPLGRTNSDLLMNTGGPVVVVPHVVTVPNLVAVT
jgi:nucleotide-binding universal stress UspA family protein